jgi:DNA ligase-1
MKAFTELYAALDETTKTNLKVAALTEYLNTVSPEDAAWAIYFLTGRKPKQLVQTPKVVGWAVEAAAIPSWLFAESYDSVGDLAETIALLLPEHQRSSDKSLTYWVEQRLIKLRGMPEIQQKEAMLLAWQELDQNQRYIWNKLITGAFRVGVSQQLVIKAIATVSGIEPAVIAHRMMGNWEPTASFYTLLIAQDSGESAISRPYPFYLAYPFEALPETLGDIRDWQAEWKWDGIRSQLIKRNGQIFIWSRGEELVTERFPELLAMAQNLPDGTVIDGEILPWREANVLPFALLQQRIGRKILSQKILNEVPVIIMAYDLLEFEGVDIREKALSFRRELLTRVVCGLPAKIDDRTTLPAQDAKSSDGQLLLAIKIPRACNPGETAEVFATCKRIDPKLRLSPIVEESSWDDLLAVRATAREMNVEGLMLKRLDSPYKVGRQRGDWWKWKINPHTIDAVLINAQRGSGKRASVYSDYTFGVWDGDKLVPIAKAYSGLTDVEIAQVDSFVRANTLEKFGPVRSVKPELVFELGFEGIQKSPRHKSGVAVRFPRMLRWRLDKPASEADSLDTLKALLPHS